MKIVYFASPSEFRAWLQRNHARSTELWLGFWRKDSGRRGITYAEALDEALCFGWIDGVKVRVDALSYAHRFSPRQPRSVWSAVNLAHVERLIAAGRMAAPGLAAFAARDPRRSGVYSFEQANAAFDATSEQRFRARRRAWAHFQALPPGYRRKATWWVVSAKREDTRARRLAQLIAACERGERLDGITGAAKPGSAIAEPARKGTTDKPTGTKSDRSSTGWLKRPRQPMPAFVRQALARRGLKMSYDARPAYQRNDYLGWIARAVRDETKRKRLSQMLDELAAGDRYMNMPWRSSQASSGHRKKGTHA